jgi:lipoprotein-releasing system permease protein|tara:strand:- start:4010 stop:5239 length:1230 start_codon:yes stop_codon:yes gene_type:complete
LNFEYFLAKRIISTKSYKNSISGPIIKIGIVAIALGVIVMLISIATGLGMQYEIKNKISAFNGDISIYNFQSVNYEDSNIPLDFNEDLYNNIINTEGITKVQKIATKFGLIRTSEDFDGVFFKGVDENYDLNRIRKFLIEGDFPNISNSISNKVIVSKLLAKRLKLNVGDSFQMLFSRNSESSAIRKFEIAGIFSSGFNELDSKYIIGDISHVQRINKWNNDQIGNLEVFIDNYENLDLLTNKIYSITPSTVNVQSIRDKYYSIFDWIKLFDKNMIAIIIIMIIVASINIITVLIVLILERTNMIGVLKSLGSTNTSLRKFFIYNSLYIVSLGLLIGNSVGLILIYLQKKYELISLDSEIYYVSSVPMHFDIYYIIGLNILTFFICFLVIILPSSLISNISPTKAVKYQ